MTDYKGTRANKFDALVGEMQWERALRDCEGGSALDVGCGIGLFTGLLCDRFERVVGIDEIETSVSAARISFSAATFVVGDATTLELSEKFDHIFMVNVLEHVEHPILVLENMKRFLAPEGIIHIVVPNAYSIHRVIGEAMGLVDSVYHLPEEQIELYGHKRVYDDYALRNDIEAAGLDMVIMQSNILKPLPNADMQRVCDEKGEEWSRKFVRALYEAGKYCPQGGCSLYAEAQHVEVQQDAGGVSKPF